MLSLPPLSLYIHIPWCVKKCPYCDFNSHESEVIPEQAYVNALLQDLDSELSNVQGRALQSIFFGGGTPSIFSGQAIEQILEGVKQRIDFVDNIEITLEANPGTVEQEKFTHFFSAGVNRLSIGVQSFQAMHLKKLGRIHNEDEAINAVNAAKQAGFQQINIDLMHGLEAQTPEQAQQDLQQAIALDVPHISWYQLTVEPNTVFYKNPPLIPIDETLAVIQEQGEKILAANQFANYEISAYAKPNCQAEHNLNYWQFGDYIGIGAGAHGKITQLNKQSIIRKWKTRLPKDYLQADMPCAGEKPIASEDLPLEFMMNALRLTEGFSEQLFIAHTGIAIQQIENNINKLIEKKLLTYDNGNYRTTQLGKNYLDSILAEF